MIDFIVNRPLEPGDILQTREKMLMFLNHYRCPRCDTNWTDEWSAMCDDDCPKCGLTCSPGESEDISEVAD